MIFALSSTACFWEVADAVGQARCDDDVSIEVLIIESSGEIAGDVDCVESASSI
jgi:hypothetical protein